MVEPPVSMCSRCWIARRTEPQSPQIPELIPVPLDADHVAICKPDSRDSLLYRRVRVFVVHFAQPRTAADPPPPIEFGPEPTVSAGSALPEPNLRRLLAEGFQRAEVAVFWFDTFGDGMDEHAPARPLNLTSVLELLLRAKRLRNKIFSTGQSLLKARTFPTNCVRCEIPHNSVRSTKPLLRMVVK